MQVEHMRNDIPSAQVTSPGQSDSSGRIEAGPSRRRSPSPPIELRRSSRRPSHSRSSTEFWLGLFDDDERPQVYEPGSRNTIPAGAVVHKGRIHGGLPAIIRKEYRWNLNNIVQQCYYAKNLPHVLQSSYTRIISGMQDLFRLMVLENTVEDEPESSSFHREDGA